MLSVDAAARCNCKSLYTRNGYGYHARPKKPHRIKIMHVTWKCRHCLAQSTLELEAPLKANLKDDHQRLAECASCKDFTLLSFEITAKQQTLAGDYLKGIRIGQIWHATGTERCLMVKITNADMDPKAPIWGRTYDPDLQDTVGKARRFSYEKFFGPHTVMELISPMA